MENFSLLKSNRIYVDNCKGKWPLVVFPHIEEIYIGCYHTIQLYSVKNMGHQLKQFYQVTPLENDDYIVDIVKIEATDELCVLSKQGAIYKLSCPDENFDDWELVGNMDAPVDVAAWNFDLSSLAVISVDGYLTFIGRYFDVIANVLVNTTDFGESRNISLGWGRESTQFVGQGVRPLASKKTTSPEEQNFQLVPYDDCKKSLISWRGDGKFIATSTWCTADNRRKIRVWSDQGLLHSTCDLNVFLEPVLSWKPNGICITSTTIPYTHEISQNRSMVFFERNGLRHGGLQLVNCELNSMVKIIQWNIDSTLLAVVIDCKPLHQVHTQLLQLWTSCNYHFYLKYETVFDDVRNKFSIENIVWYSVNCLLLLGSDGSAVRYQYTTRTDVSANNVIGVVDGYYIQFTPLSSTVIPLPYTLAGCKLNHFPNEIIYINHMIEVCMLNSHEWVLALLRDGTEMNIIEIDTGRRGCIGPRSVQGCFIHRVTVVIDKKLADAGSYSNSQLRNVIVIDKNRMFALFNDGEKDSFCMINLFHKSERFECTISAVDTVIMEVSGALGDVDFDFKQYRIIRFVQPKKWDDTSSTCFVLAECENNSLFRIDFDANSYKITVKYLYNVCSQINDAVILIGDSSICPISSLTNKNFNDSTLTILIYTDVHNSLYLNENTRLFQFCSCFYVSNGFLFAVIKMEHLYCIPLELLFENDVNDSLELFLTKITNSASGYNRVVEIGAKILCSSELDASLILQIPRGNIELIYPRSLVISKLKKLLCGKIYDKAVYLARKHRLDFNLIFDHDPFLLLNSVEIFVKQLSNPTLLNTLLNDISSTDTTETIYKDFYDKKSKTSLWDPTKKVALFMTTFRSHLEILLKQHSMNDYFNSILLTYLKENKELGYEKALFYIRDNLLSSVAMGNAKRLLINSLEFIKNHLQDDTLFYQQALGSYDLDLVVKVAEVVNKDPQEYLPFVSSLQEHVDSNPDYMRYLIDCYLQRFDKALLHLLRCEEKFEECIAFIVKHQKYKIAINSLSIHSPNYDTISKIYAEFLCVEKKAFEDASMLYRRLGIFDKAFECCLKVTKFKHFHYKNCVGYLNKMLTDDAVKNTKQQISKYQHGLLDKLIYSSNFIDAVEFADQHMNDGYQAFKMALDYHLWDSVVYLSFKANPYDTNDIDEIIRTTIQKRCESLKTFVENKVELFKHLYTQLIEYRANIAEWMSSLPEMNEDDLQSLDDSSATSSNLQLSYKSGISSNRSTSTTSTQRTITKNRKKLTKKYFVTRNGSMYEQFAVMESLANLYNDYIRFKDECCTLLPLMVTYGVIDLAKSLQSSLIGWRDLLVFRYANIWTTQQYLGPLRKDQHIPDPHRPHYKTVANELNDSSSNYDIEAFVESLTPLMSVPNLSKIKDISFFNKNLV